MYTYHNLQASTEVIFLPWLMLMQSDKPNNRFDCFTTFLNQLSEFSKKGKVVLCGDFNARAGKLGDIAEDVSWDSDFSVGLSGSEHVNRRNSR